MKNYARLIPEMVWIYTVHNEFLRRSAETGIPGGLAFLAVLIGGFRIAFRLSRSNLPFVSITAVGWTGALVAIIWQLNWVPWMGWAYNAMLWFTLGLMDGVDSKIREGGREWISQP